MPCAAVDTFTRNLLTQKFAIPVETREGALALQQCLTRLSRGGLGIPVASDTAPAAFWAGFAQSCHLLSNERHASLLASEWLVSALADVHASPQLVQAREAHSAQVLAARGVLGDIQRPAPAPAFPAGCSPRVVVAFYEAPPASQRALAVLRAVGAAPPPAHRLQKRISAVTTAHRFASFTSGHRANDPLVRRLDACAGVGGSAWLSTLPTTHFTTFRDADFLKVVRLRLGLFPIPNFPVARCPACRRRPPFADAASHLLSCTALMHCNGASTAGHNLVGKAISHHLVAAGISVNVESQDLKPNRRNRPDFLVFDAQAQRFLTDHTIVNPVASSRVRLPVQTTIESVAAKKRTTYADMAAGLGAVFTPLVFSAFGLIPASALDFLSLVSIHGSETHLNAWPSGPRGLVSSMLSSTSCAVQKRNAHIITIAAQRVLALARRGPARADL